VEAGAAHLQGWCVTPGGLPAEALAMSVGGVRYPAATLERYARPDVVRHLGLNVADCGFRARIDIPGIDSILDLGDDIQAFGGGSPGRANSPLRLAPAIVAMLQESVNAGRDAPPKP